MSQSRGNRYLVVGDYQNQPCEGMQVITTTLVNGLVAAGVAVLPVHSRRLAFRLAQVVAWSPDVIVFAHGPGAGVLLWSAVLGKLTNAKIVWLAPRPQLDECPAVLKRLSRVDLLLASQVDPVIDQILTRSGGRFVYTVHGIDLGRFRPHARSQSQSPEERARALGLAEPPNCPVLLHVGHIRPNRGIERLISLKRQLADEIELVVLGSQAFPSDRNLVEQLKGAEATVTMSFVEDIAICYRAADLYLFPTTDDQRGAVDLPLSVLEALAVGTPVLSTPFGALPKVLDGFTGIRFAQPDAFATECRDMLAALDMSTAELPPLPESFDLSLLHEKLMACVES